jgi:hypothetical protein
MSFSVYIFGKYDNGSDLEVPLICVMRTEEIRLLHDMKSQLILEQTLRSRHRALDRT